jgi:hypothetical protein
MLRVLQKQGVENFLVFNTLLNFDALDAGRKLDPK